MKQIRTLEMERENIMTSLFTSEHPSPTEPDLLSSAIVGLSAVAAEAIVASWCDNLVPPTNGLSNGFDARIQLETRIKRSGPLASDIAAGIAAEMELIVHEWALVSRKSRPFSTRDYAQAINAVSSLFLVDDINDHLQRVIPKREGDSGLERALERVRHASEATLLRARRAAKAKAEVQLQLDANHAKFVDTVVSAIASACAHDLTGRLNRRITGVELARESVCLRLSDKAQLTSARDRTRLARGRTPSENLYSCSPEREVVRACAAAGRPDIWSAETVQNDPFWKRFGEWVCDHDPDVIERGAESAWDALQAFCQQICTDVLPSSDLGLLYRRAGASLPTQNWAARAKPRSLVYPAAVPVSEELYVQVPNGLEDAVEFQGLAPHQHVSSSNELDRVVFLSCAYGYTLRDLITGEGERWPAARVLEEAREVSTNPTVGRGLSGVPPHHPLRHG